MSVEPKVESPFSQFVESVKSKIPIDALYTQLTGQQFVEEGSRLRAKVIWREDNNPSLTYYPNENLLTDFADPEPPNPEKPGRTYNVLDIFQKCGGAIGFSDALRMACEYAKVDFPDEFVKTKEIGDTPLNLGKGLKEIWELCKNKAKFFIENPDKRPASMVTFCNDRNIPMDLEFFRITNLGIAPEYDTVKGILKKYSIFPKRKDNKEVNIFAPEVAENALVFPLYNLDGGLCGLRFRWFSKKDFADWIPATPNCYFNAQRFKRRPLSRRLLMVEGEMNLVAFAIATWKVNPNQLDEALTIIYSTGSKSKSVGSYKTGFKSLLYFQDQDLVDPSSVLNPKENPLVITCTNISREIEAENLEVVDWKKIPYVQAKFDFEDLLKYNNYDLKCLRDIPTVSLPRYCVNAIKDFTDAITNEDNRRENQITLTMEIADKLKFAQRQIFRELAEKEFALSKDTVEKIDTTPRKASFGNYSINEKGEIVEKKANDHGVVTIVKTNFYLRIRSEITSYVQASDGSKVQKNYEVEIVTVSGKKWADEVPAEEVVEPSKMYGFCSRTATITDLVFTDGQLRDKFSVVTGLMLSIPVEHKTKIFSSLGRPFENHAMSLLHTDKFYLFPKISVIDGEVVENKNFEVRITHKGAEDKQMPYKFTIIDDQQFKEAGNLFWRHLRYVNNTNLMDTLISMVYDSATTELQGVGVVENDHGFPIYLEGQSGSYKTTAARFAMALIGDFKHQNSLMSYNGTLLSIEFNMLRVGHSVTCIDDMKTEDINSKEFTAFFHSIYGGTSRTRQNSTGDKQKGGDKMKCSVIVTSEGQPGIISESIAARMLVIRVAKESLEVNAERKKHLNLFLDAELGFKYDLMCGFFPRMIAWAQKRGSVPHARSIKKWKKHFDDLIEGKVENNAERPSDMVTRLVSAFEQICEFCKEHHICSEEEANEAFESFVVYWQKKIFDQITRIQKHSSKSKTVELLWQLINSGTINLKVFDGRKWLEDKKYGPTPILDITYPDERGRKLLIVSDFAVIKAMNSIIASGGTATPIIQTKFTEDLKEANVIDNVNGKTVLYPVPNDRGEINNHCRQIYGIDYNNLMKLAEKALKGSHD